MRIASDTLAIVCIVAVIPILAAAMYLKTLWVGADEIRKLITERMGFG